jgi:hypothetical protein
MCPNGYLIGYHYSPSTRRGAILRDGLVIGSDPCVNGVEDDHRNLWISLSPTAAQAWWLSGEALVIGGFDAESDAWDLWEVDITDLDRQGRLDGVLAEMQVLEDIPLHRLQLVGQRTFDAEPTSEPLLTNDLPTAEEWAQYWARSSKPT